MDSMDKKGIEVYPFAAAGDGSLRAHPTTIEQLLLGKYSWGRLKKSECTGIGTCELNDLRWVFDGLDDVVGTELKGHCE